MNRKLKILFLTNCSPLPIRDGQSRRTYNILKGLAENHEVYLLSFYETLDEISPDNIKNLESICKCVEMQQVPSKKISVSMIIRLLRSLISTDPYTIWRHYSRLFIKRIYELIETIRFDLIHCDTLPLAYTIRNIKTIPCVLTDHDVSYLKTLRIAKNTRNLLLKCFLYLEACKTKNLESKIFEQIDLGIAVSDVDRKGLEKISPKGRFEVIENGVDTEVFKPASGETEANTLLWLGGFNHYSNQEAMIYFLKSIYPLIKQKIENVKLNLVGKGPSQSLQGLITSDSSIESSGFVDNPLKYIEKASIFIAPILSGSGTRLKIMEAMAMEKAIVTTTIGCEGICGVDGRHYSVADKPEEFAEKVIGFLKNKKLQEYFGNNARKLATEKYDWKIICNKQDLIYKNLVISGGNY